MFLQFLWSYRSFQQVGNVLQDCYSMFHANNWQIFISQHVQILTINILAVSQFGGYVFQTLHLKTECATAAWQGCCISKWFKMQPSFSPWRIHLVHPFQPTVSRLIMGWWRLDYFFQKTTMVDTQSEIAAEHVFKFKYGVSSQSNG